MLFLKPLNISTLYWKQHHACTHNTSPPPVWILASLSRDFILSRCCPKCTRTFLQSYWEIQPPLSRCSPLSSPGTWWVKAHSRTPCTAAPHTQSCAWAACSRRCTWKPGTQPAQWSSTVSMSVRGSWWSTPLCSRCLCFDCRSHRESWGRKNKES